MELPRVAVAEFKEDIGERIRDYLSEYGAFILHGLDRELIANTQRAAQDQFETPFSGKGCWHFYENNAGGKCQRDVMQIRTSAANFASSQPECAGKLYNAIVRLEEVTKPLAERLLQFVNTHGIQPQTQTQFSAAKYYANNPTSGEIRIKSHDDDMTFFNFKTRPGLQIYSQGTWVSVDVEDDEAAIVPGRHIGNLNGNRLTCTEHRVLYEPTLCERHIILWGISTYFG